MADLLLHNPSGLSEMEVKRVVALADLPPGLLLLYLGDDTLEADYQAVTIARPHIRYFGNINGLEDFLHVAWDCGIVMGSVSCEFQSQFPAYFAYLLAHELGHAATVLTDPSITAFEHLITTGMASISPSLRWDELPHEARYDQLGLAVAELACGRAAVEAQFTAMIDGELVNDSARLRKVLTMQPRRSLAGLVEDLASFTQPHLEELLQIWRAQQSSLSSGFAGEIRDLESLWRNHTG